MDVTPPLITCPATLNLFVMHRYLLRILVWLLQPMPVVLQQISFVSDAANLLVVSRPLQELTVLLMPAVTVLYVLSPL